jgi:hypothetical protein
MYKEYIKHKEKILKKQIDHSKRLNEWYVTHFKYAQKLVDIFNLAPCKQELEEYIRKIDPTSPVLQIITDKRYILKTMTHDEVKELKNYPHEPYYWVCRFKDEHLDRVRKERPINRIKGEILTYLNPLSILTKVSDMIPWWMQNNKNMKLYVIKINFTKNSNNNCIYYYDRRNKKNRCYRTLDENKPCCRPI